MVTFCWQIKNTMMGCWIVLLWFSGFTLGVQHDGTVRFLVWCLDIRDDSSVLMDFWFMNLFFDDRCWCGTLGLLQFNTPVSQPAVLVALVRIKTILWKPWCVNSSCSKGRWKQCSKQTYISFYLLKRTFKAQSYYSITQNVILKKYIYIDITITVFAYITGWRCIDSSSLRASSWSWSRIWSLSQEHWVGGRNTPRMGCQCIPGYTYVHTLIHS